MDRSVTFRSCLSAITLAPDRFIDASNRILAKAIEQGVDKNADENIEQTRCERIINENVVACLRDCDRCSQVKIRPETSDYAKLGLEISNDKPLCKRRTSYFGFLYNSCKTA